MCYQVTLDSIAVVINFHPNVLYKGKASLCCHSHIFGIGEIHSSPVNEWVRKTSQRFFF